MKHNFRKAALSTICMLIVAVMSLTGVTYAWFTAGDTAKVSGMSMQVVNAAGGLEVAEKGSSTWGSTLTLQNAGIPSVDPVSTVDAVNFVAWNSYNPANSAEMDVKTADTADYIVKELSLRNTGTEDITIDFRNTYIKDIANTGNSNTTTDIGKAARIAIFVETNKNYQLKGIMAPYYDAALTTGFYACDETAYMGIKADAAGKGYFEYGATSGTYLQSVSLYNTDSSQMEITIPGMENDVPQVVNIKVVVWLEGQDADCKNANAGGAFDIYLQFNKTNATIADLDHAA